ncbi:MAG: PDZ domain-containing protein [Kiritimatiellae bacterium]|nr:PDZ domain-containing protein [Kiritimatiellia bacterium]
MKLTASMFSAVAATIVLPLTLTAADKPEVSPLAKVERNRKLTEKFSSSIATVRYFLTVDENGETPNFSVKYLCPNCNDYHEKDANDFINNDLPLESPGFVLAPDLVLIQNPKLRKQHFLKIEVFFGGKSYIAEPSATFPDQDGLLLKTAQAIEGAKPLEFTGKTPQKPEYFYLIIEDGLAVSGIRKSQADNFKHYPEINRDYYKGVPNSIVVNEKDEAVTVSLQEEFELGKEAFDTPDKWRRTSADDFENQCVEIEKGLAKSILPIYLRLASKPNQSGGRMFFRHSSSKETKDENDLFGYALPNGEVAIPRNLSAEETARIEKIEFSGADGKKQNLDFVGSLDEYGVFIAKFPNGQLPAGYVPLPTCNQPIISLFHQAVFCCKLRNENGHMTIRAFPSLIDEFELQKGGKVVPEGDFLVSVKGEVISIPAKMRVSSSRYSDSDIKILGNEFASMFGASRKFNPEYVPREGKDRIRTAWLGVDVQPLTDELIREKKLSAFITDEGSDGALVSHVYPDTSASELGIKVGDVLLYIRPANSQNRTSLEASEDASEIPWARILEEASVEMFDNLDITPWPSIPNELNQTVSSFGIGSKVYITWVSDGKKFEKPTTVRQAPTHYQNAPTVRDRELGIVVADMTFEVRNYMKLEENAPGVVITKMKGGSPAAVAGLRPTELITEVNGKPVTSAKDFSEKIKGLKDLTFSVRRLTATRVVRIQLNAKNENAEDK